jgi:hypothetical protein
MQAFSNGYNDRQQCLLKKLVMLSKHYQPFLMNSQSKLLKARVVQIGRVMALLEVEQELLILAALLSY